MAGRRATAARWTAGAVAALALALGAAPPVRAAEPKGAWVVATTKTLHQYAPAVGTFRARQTARLGPQVSGRVDKVLVDVGDVVKAGQPLLKLDPGFFQIDVNQRQAGLSQARVMYDQAELAFLRVKKLWQPSDGGTAAVSQQQFDDAKAQLDAALGRVNEAQAGVEAAEKRLSEATIRAPFDAAVTRRLVDVGDSVTSAPLTVALEVQEVQVLDLEFSLPQHMLARVKKGTPVRYQPAGGRDDKAEGVISLVYPVVDEATRSFKCRVRVDNRDLRYSPGQLVNVEVQEREIGNAVVIPRQAAIETSSGWQVRVEQNGAQAPRAIKVGLVTEQEVEVRDGLRTGERVWLPERG
jgi:RND family efflux transporter MFP subunit